MLEQEKMGAIESRIKAAVEAETVRTEQPEFSIIAERIAAGEPVESFEDFFASDGIQEPKKAKGGAPLAGWKKKAAASAAVLLLFIAGGVLIGTLLSGMAMTKYADDSAMYNETRGAYMEEDVLDSYCEDESKNTVSDSDLHDNDADGSSDSSE